MPYKTISVFDFIYLRNGSCEISDLVKEFYQLGYKAIGFCNYGNLIGAISFFHEAKKLGIKTIIGMQVEIACFKNLENSFFVKLYSFNMKGYFNLVTLASFAKLEGTKLQLKLRKEQLEKHSEGIFCFIGDCNTVESPNIIKKPFEADTDAVIFCKHIFGDDRVFIELQTIIYNFQNQTNKNLVQTSSSFNLPLIASIGIGNAGELSNRQMYNYSPFTFANNNLRESFSAQNRIDFNLITNVFYLKPECNLKALPYIDEIIENTHKMLNKVNIEFEFCKKYYPKIKNLNNISERKLLESLAIDGLNSKTLKGELCCLTKLYDELAIIDKKGLTSLFLLIWDINELAKTNNFEIHFYPIPLENSLVAYVLGITNINVIQFQLFHELGYLENENIELCIRINEPFEKRRKIIDLFILKYGKNKIFLITPARKKKNADRRLRIIANLLGISKSIIDRFAILVYSKFSAISKYHLENEFLLKTWCEKEVHIQALLNIATIIYNREIQSSLHDLIIFSDKAIQNRIPIVKSKLGVEAQVSQYEIYQNPLLNIFFGSAPTGAKYFSFASELIYKTQKLKIIKEEIPLNDKKTFNSISEYQIFNLPHLENETILKRVCARVNLNTFDDFILMIYLNFMGYTEIDGKPYFSRGSTLVAIQNECSSEFMNNPVLKKILKETMGYIFFQEQVLQITNLVGGFSTAESITFLESLSFLSTDKIKEGEKTSLYRNLFLNGCRAKGISLKLAEEVYTEMTRIRLCTKSYIVACSLVCYQNAYLKFNFPEEYLAAYYTIILDNDQYDDLAFFSKECKLFKIDILPPDINESDWSFKPSPGKIRLGFNIIKGVGKQPIIALLNNRAKGRFLNMQDFCSRCVKHVGDIATFVAINNVYGFESLEKSRAKVIDKINLTISSFSKKETL